MRISILDFLQKSFLYVISSLKLNYSALITFIALKASIAKRIYAGSLLISLLILLQGCLLASNVDTEYNKSGNQGSVSSGPIYLSFRNNKGASYYFLLQRSLGDENYYLKVHWNSTNSDILFKGIQTTLRFVVNKEKVLTFNPIKKPRIIAYNIEPQGHQEEAIFKLTQSEMETLAGAKTVESELTGKYIIVLGRFNKYQTFPSFKKFLNQY